MVEDGVGQMHLFGAPIWYFQGGGGTRDTGSIVVESLAGQSSTCKLTVARSIGWVRARFGERVERGSIVNELGKCWTLVREIQRLEPRGFSEKT